LGQNVYLLRRMSTEEVAEKSFLEILEEDRKESKKKKKFNESLINLRCTDFFWEFRGCLSASRQFQHYYIHGEYSDCKKYSRVMRACMRYKLYHEKEDWQELFDFNMEGTEFKTKSVWKKRKNRSKYWKESCEKADAEKAARESRYVSREEQTSSGTLLNFFNRLNIWS